MSAANLAAGTFGDVYHEAPADANADADEARETILGLQRLNLMASEREGPAQKPGNRTAPVPMPQLVGNQRSRPLTLVELPVDVLKDIVKEVTHTNDLTNLCLTCRCLHSLAIPQIYSRFDIVWPDAATTGDRVGVDALTHGLATLTNSTRRGNDHARWVKKFSLGNGPAEWVNEYNINKEGGKMLGTLVNLGIARMESLESFSWDMPTGILRDVFMSLHDLHLKNLHVRFHDNRDTTPPTSQDPSRRVESPTFRGFKGLKSLSVLDIDERQYFEEMSYAVEESADKLKDLRVGIAEHMTTPQWWIRDWDDLENANAAASQDGGFGGALGILFGRIVNLEEGRRRRRSNRLEDPNTTSGVAANVAVETAEAVVMTSGAPAAVYVNSTDSNNTVSGDGNDATPTTETPTPQVPDAGNESLEAAEAVPANEPPAETTVPAVPTTPATPPLLPASNTSTKSVPRFSADSESRALKQLKLETLALERVPISVSVLVNTKAIDWTFLSSLTIINCYNHERLWKSLRRKFLPFPAPTSSASLHSSGINIKNGHLHTPLSQHRARNVHQQTVPLDYKIRLKKLHTDCVTPVLIAFIRETLPPNSLEILFLQETANDSTVTMESIYKGAIRRHKGSLRKLMVNSKSGEDADSVFKWMFKKEHLAFVSSGKMPNLRELGVALEYKDWHYFLTRLPHMQQLRSLYITHIRDTPHLTAFAPRELANQILNTVILRPEIELCYVGILFKCFEILEGRNDDPDLPEVDAQVPPVASQLTTAEQDSEDEEESELEDDDEDDDDLADDDDVVDDSESDGGYAEEEKFKTGIRLREILFYDDKVEIFRARNASL